MGAPSRGVLGAVVLWCRAPGRGRPVFPRVGPCAPGGAGCRWLRARLPAGRSSSPALGPLRGLLPSEGGTAGKLRKAAAGVLQSQVVQQVNLRRNWSKETVLSGTVKFLFGNSVTSLIYFSGVEERRPTIWWLFSNRVGTNGILNLNEEVEPQRRGRLRPSSSRPPEGQRRPPSNSVRSRRIYQDVLRNPGITKHWMHGGSLHLSCIPKAESSLEFIQSIYQYSTSAIFITYPRLPSLLMLISLLAPCACVEPPKNCGQGSSGYGQWSLAGRPRVFLTVYFSPLVRILLELACFLIARAGCC
ncbi:uncharacterized protein [Anas platyrhynchos]|uniref:uncharacterized protein isoform X2 n=1 Tax=Anas platyrhynchos TaxID=8839 RepID=UPI003AF270C4